MSKKRKGGLEAARNRMGYTFVVHWLLGFALFFLYPLVNSIWYSFNDVTVNAGSIDTKYIGWEHFRVLLQVNPNYVDNLSSSVLMMLYSLPIIISLSLILAVLLNLKFKGRTIFRAICFLPVIMTNSAVMNQLNGDYVSMPLFSSGEEGVGIIDYMGIIEQLNLPEGLNPILVFLLSNTINLIWSCGVQTILFLSGLQSISPSFYEVSKIEGANKWDEFWLITVPSLRNIIMLVIIYTMIELFVDSNNVLVSTAYNNMTNQKFGQSSAMLWMYFVVVIILIGLVLSLYQRFCMKRWE